MSKPTREQIASLKAREPGTILLFSVHTGYAAYDDDATAIELVAGIDDVRVSMAGQKIAFVAKDALEDCLDRIVAAGKRAAVCEQVATTVECRAARTVQVTDDDGEAD